MRYMTLALSIGLLYSQELEVEGNLKVTGEIDASEQRIKNVAEPALSTDAATAYYVDERTAGKGRIITLKCPWVTTYFQVSGNPPSVPSTGSCEAPGCPEGWTELAVSNETTSSAVWYSANQGAGMITMTGNPIRYCMEDEE